MADDNEALSGTFRCPVCGHRGAADLGQGKESLLTPCSYCETLLEVRPRTDDSIRFRAQVAEEAKD